MTLAPIARPSARRRSDDGTLIERTVTVPLAHGIHARPAARIGECARGFEAEVEIVQRRAARQCPQRRRRCWRSGTRFGDELLVEARGGDAEAALAAVVALIGTDMGEGAPAHQPRVRGRRGRAPGRADRRRDRFARPRHRPGAGWLRRQAIAVAREGTGAAEERAALDTARGRCARGSRRAPTAARRQQSRR